MNKEIIKEMMGLQEEKESKHLSKFFKTGKGEYGEGDLFLGIRVPVTRSIVKKYKDNVKIDDISTLIDSEWHEIRLAGFLLLTELYKKCIKNNNREEAWRLTDFYLRNIGKGNNWDLVDLISYNILGDWVVRNPSDEKILFDLSGMEGSLWHQRVAIVSTLALIKNRKFYCTFKISEKYLTHPHDLIHKATGWMLREVGKRGGEKELRLFLDKHKNEMPRTMLRYAIERFPEEERQYYLNK